jgi:hypothetical protein
MEYANKILEALEIPISTKKDLEKFKWETVLNKYKHIFETY